MSHGVNETIGIVTCPICENPAEVRQYRNKPTLYWVCRCGKMTPSRSFGQDWILSHARMLSDQERAELNARRPDFRGMRLKPGETWPPPAQHGGGEAASPESEHVVPPPPPPPEPAKPSETPDEPDDPDTWADWD